MCKLCRNRETFVEPAGLPELHLLLLGGLLPCNNPGLMAEAPDSTSLPRSGTLKETPSQHLVVIYSNYASVAAAPEECVFRFSQRSLDSENDATEVVRIYLPIAHAKRLVFAMSRTIKVYEELFGEIAVEPQLTPEGRKVMGLPDEKKVNADD